MTHEEIQQTIELVTFATYVASHVLALTGTPKWFPKPLVTVINIIAANYGKSKNRKQVDTDVDSQ